MRGLILGASMAVFCLPLSGCLDGTVDRGLFAHTEAETARRVAVAVPMGLPKAEAIAAMTKAGWGCAPARDIFDASVGRRIYADAVHCEAQPARGGDFHAKHYFADFMFRDGKVALRNVWMVDPGI